MSRATRFLNACRCEPTDCTPVWIMRQAGRYQASYQALRREHSFMELCKTPELAAQVTLAAVNELGVDAAIIFSDILVAVEGMGAPVEFTDSGPLLHAPIRDAAAVDALGVPDPQESFPYLLDAVRLVRRELDGEVPLIGFVGAPLTLASYLVEGANSKSYIHLRELLFGQPEVAHRLLDKLSRTVAAQLRAQAEAGCQAVQIFDSWGGILNASDYAVFGAPYIRRIVEELGPSGVPRILFGTGTGHLLELMVETGVEVLGVDWRADLGEVRQRVGPGVALQGNLDPGYLFLEPEQLRQRIQQVLRQTAGAPGHIFNLGHGVLPNHREQRVRQLVQDVHRLSARAPGAVSATPLSPAARQTVDPGAGLEVLEQVDAERLVQLSRPGPRYTSYPTVPEWTDEVDGQLLQQHLQLAEQQGPEAPLSLYFHIPFCRSMCTYCGCNVVITRRPDKADRYIDYLAREMDLVCRQLPRRRSVIQLHLGGGTPTFLGELQLLRLWDEVRARFTLLPGAEVALEIDPVVTSTQQLALLRGMGFNRVSMGIQDFTPQVQQAVGRVQSAAATWRLLRYARELGYGGINVDLIYGLPHQREQTFASTLDRVIEMRPDRVAVFGYAHVPWMRPHQKQLDEAAIPGPADRFRLFVVALRRFLEAGYVQIGMDHFALPDDELSKARLERRLRRNFQGYTVLPAADILAFGITGISEVQGCYTQNQKTLAAYYRCLEQGQLPVERGRVLTEDDRLRRRVIHQIMCNFHVDLEQQCAPFEVSAAKTFAGELEALQECLDAGLVERRELELSLTPLGRILVRNVAMVFDPYLRKKGDQGSTFSKTV